MKSYLLVYNGTQATRRSVTARIDSMDAIANWIAFFENALCLVSELNVGELTEKIHVAIPDVQFVITPLDKAKKNGWLPKSVWNFMNLPSPVEAESAA